jgi:serine/threonine-protein kinase
VLPIATEAAATDPHLAVGLAEEMADYLAALPDLAVKPRTLVASLAKSSDGLTALAHALGVDHVVLGELTRTDGGLRLELRLVYVPEWAPTWSMTFDIDPTDPLLVPRQAASEIGAALERAPAVDVAPPTPRNAAGMFLHGRYLYRSNADHREMDRAVSLLAGAHALAPDDARIAATYALALARRDARTVALVDSARAVAERAVELGPNTAEAYLALALVNHYEGEARACAAALRRAYALDSNHADVLGWMGLLLAEVGALREALALMDRALAVDPSLVGVAAGRVRALALLGDDDAAFSAAAQLAAGPKIAGMPMFLLTRMYLWRPTVERGAVLSRALEAASISDSRRRLFGVLVRAANYEVLDDEDLSAADAVLSLRDCSPRTMCFRAQVRIEIFAGTTLAHAAIESLEVLEGQSFIDVSWLDGCPRLVPLHGHPELVRLRRTAAIRAARVRAALLV